MAHLALVVVAGVVYIYNMARQSERMAEKCNNIDLASTASLPCSLALVSGFGNFGSIDLLLHTLLVSCLSLVSICVPSPIFFSCLLRCWCSGLASCPYACLYVLLLGLRVQGCRLRCGKKKENSNIHHANRPEFILRGSWVL